MGSTPKLMNPRPSFHKTHSCHRTLCFCNQRITILIMTVLAPGNTEHSHPGVALQLAVRPPFKARASQRTLVQLYSSTRPSNSSSDKHARSCSRSFMAGALHSYISPHAPSLALSVPKAAVHRGTYLPSNPFSSLIASCS